MKILSLDCCLEFTPMCVGCKMIRNWKRFFPCQHVTPSLPAAGLLAAPGDTGLGHCTWQHPRLDNLIDVVAPTLPTR